jgi:hypothetical protein
MLGTGHAGLSATQQEAGQSPDSVFLYLLINNLNNRRVSRSGLPNDNWRVCDKSTVGFVGWAAQAG